MQFQFCLFFSYNMLTGKKLKKKKPIMSEKSIARQTEDKTKRTKKFFVMGE